MKKKSIFPPPETFLPDQDIIAMGGDILPETLLDAYSHGIFPWYNPGEDILWWCPAERFVIFPAELKVPKSMRKILNKNGFEITENQCFKEVIRACGETKREGQDGTWISEELISSFIDLHKKGIAKSVEAWKEGKLLGGFYGLKIGNIFCGESMFAHASNASKAAFITFVEKHKTNYQLIDCQTHSNHLESLGARMIPREEFLKLIKNTNFAD